MMENGKVLEVTKTSAKITGTVPAGRVLVDGLGVGDVGSIVLRDRKHLAEDGLVVVVASLNMEEGLVFSGPDIVSRGFVFVKESGNLMDDAQATAYDTIMRCHDRNIYDWGAIKGRLRDDLSRLMYEKTKRYPMILPIFMEN
mgnify:CR=1 FL=1